MYAAEKLFKSLTVKDLYYTLHSFVDNDYYLDDFSSTHVQKDFLYMLILYNLVFVASDKRILLTPKGEKVMQSLIVMLI